MKSRTHFYALALILILWVSGKARVQNQIAKSNRGDSLTVTAFLANQQVRFTATLAK